MIGKFRRNKQGRVVRIVVDSILPHAKCGPNDQRKDVPPFMKRPATPNYVTINEKFLTLSRQR